jgi:hypothetical protein
MDSAASTERQLRYVLECVVDGRMTVPEARKRLRGMPTEPRTAARWLKDGRWASEGGLPTGVHGARLAAREALRELG